LLVVIAIIGILASLLLPALSRAREMGRRAVCKSVFRQQLTGIGLYAGDNNGALLPGYRRANRPNDVVNDETWMLNPETFESQRDDYLGGVDAMFACPNQAKAYVPNSSYAAWLPDGNLFPGKWLESGTPYMLGFEYTGNKPGLNSQNGGYAYPVRQLADCGDVPLFADHNNWSATYGRSFIAHTASGGLAMARYLTDTAGGADPWNLGSEGGNFGYADGSVVWLDIGDLDPYFTWRNDGRSLFPKDMW
jgi:prepilin-type processing-associated H-X9-DG protein